MTTFESLDPPAAAPSSIPGIEENPPGGPMHNAPLGTLVLRAGLMPQQEIETALHESVHGGRRLGETLIDRGLAERDLVRLLAAQRAQPFVDLSAFSIQPDVARLLPPGASDMYCAIPIARVGEYTVVAVPDADNAVQRERLGEALEGPLRLVTAARTDIKQAILRIHKPAAANGPALVPPPPPPVPEPAPAVEPVPVVELAPVPEPTPVAAAPPEPGPALLPVAAPAPTATPAPEPEPEPEPEPAPTPPPPPAVETAAPAPYAVQVTLDTGSQLIVGEAADREAAEALAWTVVRATEPGGVLEVGDARVPGDRIVSIDILSREVA